MGREKETEGGGCGKGRGTGESVFCVQKCEGGGTGSNRMRRETQEDAGPQTSERS